MIGVIIKELRIKRGYTQSKFAKMIKITQPNLSRIERGEFNPSKKRLKVIAKKLKVNTSILCIMSLSIDDVPDNKRKVYNMVIPVIKDLLLSLT